MNVAALRVAWAAYEHDNAQANTEFWRARALADEPVLCGNGEHEMTPDNIRTDGQGKRRCITCDKRSRNRYQRRYRQRKEQEAK
jgi:uncharacterized CHY-type Zn-finger protein